MRSRTVVMIGGGAALAAVLTAATVIGVTGRSAMADHVGQALEAKPVIVHRTATVPVSVSTTDDEYPQTVSAPEPKELGRTQDARTRELAWQRQLTDSAQSIRENARRIAGAVDGTRDDADTTSRHGTPRSPSGSQREQSPRSPDSGD